MAAVDAADAANVALATLVLRIAEARTLKDKRSVVKSVVDRVGLRFRIAIAEVACQEQPKEAVLGLAAVSALAAHAEERVQSAVRFIESHYPVEIVACRVERL